MSSLTPIALACEYLDHPLAIERPDPRLSWRSQSATLVLWKMRGNM